MLEILQMLYLSKFWSFLLVLIEIMQKFEKMIYCLEIIIINWYFAIRTQVWQRLSWPKSNQRDDGNTSSNMPLSRFFMTIFYIKPLEEFNVSSKFDLPLANNSFGCIRYFFLFFNCLLLLSISVLVVAFVNSQLFFSLPHYFLHDFAISNAFFPFFQF